MPADKRVSSIDLLRGVVMVIMALDHVRDFFHADAFHHAPDDLDHVSAATFLTRWITHYCAPVFVFLAGTSAWFVHRRRTTTQLSSFLVKRGIWLVFVEAVIISFLWTFNPTLPAIFLGVIWAIGISMIALAGLVHLPARGILLFGLVLVLGHNALDDLHPAGLWWGILHEQVFRMVDGRLIGFIYPLIPWIGVMALGYVFGGLYAPERDPAQRRRLLRLLGMASIALFLVLRLTDVYGDPRPWEPGRGPAFAFLSVLNATKYPPSLHYLLMTLGPAFLFLSVAEARPGPWARRLIVFGRVPFFYYVMHLVVIHAFAILAVVLLGRPWTDMVLDTFVIREPHLQDYGFSLPVVYGVWVAVVVLLYPACRWFAQLKRERTDWWWLSYL